MITVTTADELRSIAALITLTRTCDTIRIDANEIDLGDEGVVFGGLVNQETLVGLKIVGEGMGHVYPNGRGFGGTVIRYSGTGDAIKFQGVSNSSISDLAIHAPNGTAIGVEASIIGSAWSTNDTFRRIDVSGSRVGFSLRGMDSERITAGQDSGYMYGQVDNQTIEDCVARDVSVAVVQNAPNIVNTTIRKLECLPLWAGLVMLEGTFKVYDSVFLDRGPVGLAAIFAANAKDIVIRDTRFELDGMCAFYALETKMKIGSQIFMQGNLVTHGDESYGIRIDRTNTVLVTDDYYGMRGTPSWKMHVNPDVTWIERRPRNPQVNIEPESWN